MFLRLPTSFLRLLVVILACGSMGHAEENDLRLSLEKIYIEWRSALLAHNLKAWQTCTTAYRQMLTYNLIVSQKLRYPDAIFDLPVTPPDVRKLKLMEVEAVGPTAHLIYFGKIDLGIGTGDAKEIPESLLMLKFFKDKDGWRFDSTKFINLAESPEMREDCKRGNPEFLKHPPYNPPGVVPAVPKACKEPVKVAALRVQAFGYEVTAEVNGYENSPVADRAEQQLIIGGLNRGDNPTVLHVKQLPVPEGEERFLEVEAVLITNSEKEPTIRVFDWLPKSHPVAEKIELNIVIDNRTQKGI